ncbi:MAG: DoxX family protein [Bdellovibrionales bacterium]
MSQPETKLKIKSVTFYFATGLISLMMVFSAYSYFTSDQLVAAFKHLGFPDYFRAELGIAKILGVVALWAPGFRTIKEWAYAGFTITFVSAFIAHSSSGDPASAMANPVVALILLGVSYFTRKTE